MVGNSSMYISWGPSQRERILIFKDYCDYIKTIQNSNFYSLLKIDVFGYYRGFLQINIHLLHKNTAT